MLKVAYARMIRFESANVGRFSRLDEFFHQIALGLAGIRAGGPCRLVRRQTLAEPGPRTLQCAVRGSNTDLEQVSGILGGPVKHVTQNQSGPLLRCEQLDHRKKCEFDAFARKRHRLRRPRRRGGWLEH